MIKTWSNLQRTFVNLYLKNALFFFFRLQYGNIFCWILLKEKQIKKQLDKTLKNVNDKNCMILWLLSTFQWELCPLPTFNEKRKIKENPYNKNGQNRQINENKFVSSLSSAQVFNRITKYRKCFICFKI